MDPSTSKQFALRQKTSHTSIKWSPHAANIFAVGSAANFGIVGTGSTSIRSIEQNQIKTLAVLEEKDAIFDISWFQLNDQFVLIGSGSGDVSFWQIGKNRSWVLPLNSEVHSVQCAYKNPLFIAGCVNGFLHVGSTESGKSLFSLPAHIRNCNQVQWHPSSEKVFASCGGDGLLKLWDHTLQKPNISTNKAHDAEILSIDFNKYNQQIATTALDKTIRLWDLRNLTMPLNVMQHHRYPAKKLRFSPHQAWLLGSGSYDMNVHFYDLRDEKDPLKFKCSQHTQFVSGLDFNLYEEKLVASVGWDGRILIWQFDRPQPITT